MSCKIAYIDLETTGLFAYRNGIHQIAMILEVDGEIVAEENFKCAPFRDDVVDMKALEVCGVSLEQIQSYPEPRSVFKQITSLLCKYVSKYDKTDKFHFVGYNAKFDEEFLRSFWRKNGDQYFGSFFWTPIIDVMTILGHHLRSQRNVLPNFKLGTVCEALGIEADGDLHDAMVDIKLTRQLYNLICAHTIWESED